MDATSSLFTTPQQKRNEGDQKLIGEILQTLPKERGWRCEHLVHYQGFWFSPQPYLEGVLKIQQHFRPKPSDIILATYPKCGTTWLKALLFAIINRGIHHDLSAHPLLTSHPRDLVPFLDTSMRDGGFVSHLEDLPSPRLFCTHTPYALLPDSIKASDYCRIITIYRDPKDVLISLWYFTKKLLSETLPPLSLEDSFELFCDGVSDYGPFWDHVLDYRKASLETPEKVLFLKYEDMKREPMVHAKRLAEFLGKPFSAKEESEGVVDGIVKLCSFENLSSLEVNRSTTSRSIAKNPDFFRKGQVGDWENHLTPAMAARIDRITKEKLHGILD